MVNFLTSDSVNTIGCQRTHAYCNRIDGEKEFFRSSILDWLDTHQIKPTSNYYNGHLDTENHENVKNCTYYIVFEQNYKNIKWWKSKKERMENKTEEQTKVNI